LISSHEKYGLDKIINLISPFLPSSKSVSPSTTISSSSHKNQQNEMVVDHEMNDEMVKEMREDQLKYWKIKQAREMVSC